MASQPSTSGKLVVLDGPDGTGKSTAAKAVTNLLRASGIEVVEARLPGGTPVGESIREFFKSHAGNLNVEDQIALLMLAKRHLLNEVIRPALDRGAYVVCDRFTDSLFAYQWAGFSEFNPAIRRRIEDGLLLYGIDIEVDVKIILDCPISMSQARMRERNATADAIDDLDIDFKRRVRSYYRDHMKECVQGSTVYINTVEGLKNTLVDLERVVRTLLFPTPPRRLNSVREEPRLLMVA